MLAVRVLSFITAFLIPVFFGEDRLERTVSVESTPVSLVIKNECITPLELYLTVDIIDTTDNSELKLLRTQNGQSVLLFSGNSKALVSSEFYIGTLTAGESMTFTAQCEGTDRIQMTIRGRPQESAPGRWIVRVSLIFGWGVLAVGGSALLVRRIQTHKKKS